jgi:hypothetical protein
MVSYEMVSEGRYVCVTVWSQSNPVRNGLFQVWMPLSEDSGMDGVEVTVVNEEV